MELIIAEKPIAGRKIAELLADSNIVEKRFKGVPFFEFKWQGKDFMVIPLRGHVIDVDFPKKFAPWIGTDLRNLTKAEIDYIPANKEVVDLLKSNAKQTDLIVIATDADREGESIGLEALNVIASEKPGIKTKRALFSAISKQDLDKAFANLGDFNTNLADSADSRREIDLVWGSVFTRFLSIASGKLGKEFLSAGRVQSPTLALVVKREKERIAFKPETFFEIEALLEKEEKKFKAQHKEGKIKDAKKAEEIMSKKADSGVVKKITKTKRTLKKPEPFNTTSFLKSATGIGFSAGRAMSTAEMLYQKGFTSYPRTDNTVYPKSLDFKKTLNKLSKIERFKDDVSKLLAQNKLEPSRGKKETTDHPPIHPVEIPKGHLSDFEWKIYELICRRFFATLAEEAQTENLSVQIDINSEIFIANGQRYVKKGWKEFYPYSKATETILPDLKENDVVDVKKINLFKKETQPPKRYSQGSLIQLMADKNLGTKSTRHNIIQKLYSRKYLSGNKAVEPNKIAFAVVEVLEKFGHKVIEPKMTADLEIEMDEIAAGKKSKEEVVNGSRNALLEILTELLENKDKIGAELRFALSADGLMMKCTDKNCNGHLLIRKGRTGKRFLGCSAYPKCTVTYPLPQKGRLKVLEEECPECKAPMMKVTIKKYNFTMCINHKCKSKEAWRKEKEEKNKK